MKTIPAAEKVMSGLDGGSNLAFTKHQFSAAVMVHIGSLLARASMQPSPEVTAAAQTTESEKCQSLVVTLMSTCYCLCSQSSLGAQPPEIIRRRLLV